MFAPDRNVHAVSLSHYTFPEHTAVTQSNVLRLSLALAAVLTVGVVGCSEETNEPSKAGTFYGTTAVVGKGTARTYTILDDAGKPIEIGVALSDSATAGLSFDSADAFNPGNFVKLSMPGALTNSPIDHVSLDWNPAGHPPMGTYTLPHWDVHFYLISEAEQNAILPSDPEFATKGAKLPEGDFLPPKYIFPPGSETVPQMGSHLIDPTSHEHSGHVFDKTFIYGFYNGKVIFIEPMITWDYILSKPNSTTDIPVPAKYQKAGYYPTKYTVTYNAEAKEHRIGLSGLQLH